MHRAFTFAVAVIVAVVAFCPAYAAEPCAKCTAPCVARGPCQPKPCPDPCSGDMGRKFCRGVTNVFTGWIEIPAQISKGYKRQCLYGATVGILTGVWYAAGRTLAGFYDMAGFWAADPCSNEGVGIPLDAEYAWEEGCHYDLIHPKYGKATIEPFGKKLGRGVGNAAFGLLDVPGQMMKAMKCNAFDLGIGKALWYFASREFDGLYEIASSPFPNPCDTAGVKFDEEWPWQAVKADRWW